MKKTILILLAIILLLSSCSSSFPKLKPSRELRSDKIEEVDNWFYYLGFDDLEKNYKAILASDYDLVVIEPVFTEKNNLDYDISKFVNALHNKKDRLVVAYIDIGQAEEWRSYWQADWVLGNPEWIVATDPDGWEGNYPVAYWYKDWQDIFLNPKTGYLQKLLDAGFDGVYLDWIEAYSDNFVLTKAKTDGVNTVEEMINWVEKLGRYARAQRPEFLVIAQNAAELTTNDDYLEVIDALAQEQIWFDGGSDNNPPGDCPLPNTATEIDSQNYFNSLSPACQRVYTMYPESTLHVSSSEYLVELVQARANGLPIFTVDYALNEDNIKQVYKNSKDLGFIPFASNRLLNIFVPERY
ncbi:MAG TPA: hypothetical protein ENK21_06685 [Trueperaceae bacterium]|nr:hypothetical protein [Trueperaceae bacterium]